MTRQKDPSQLDPGGVLKSAHDFESDSLRTINGLSEVPSSYDRVETTYDNGSVIEACFYRGVDPLIFEVIMLPDVSSSLNSTYFTLTSGMNENTYYVWYSVDGAGVDPAVPDAKGIKVDLVENDDSSVVAFATFQQLKIIDDFIVRQSQTKLIVENYKRGPAASPVDGGTNFVFFVTQAGTEELIKSIFPPISDDTTYIYNEIEKKFEVSSVGSAVSIIIENIENLQGLLRGVAYDAVYGTYPDGKTEVYDFQLMAVSQAEITITYTDASKRLLESAIRTA